MAFAFYTPVTVDHTKCGSSDSSNFPVLVSVTDARLATVSNGGHVQNANGYDIRPYADSGGVTALSFELVSYNATTGKVEMWVKVPTLSHTADTPIYLFYGDAGISTNGSSSSTWSNGFSDVQHWGNGSSLSTADSTGNATPTTSGSPAAGSGVVGGAVALDGSSSVDLGSGINSTLNGSAFTLSTSLNPSNNACVIFGARGSTHARVIGVGIWASGQYSLLEENVAVIAGFGTTDVGHWHRIVWVYNGSTHTFYVDGVQVGSPVSYTFAGNDTGTGPWGGTLAGGGQFTGSLDESYIASVARSADWILAEYNNQNSPSTFSSFGTEVPVGGGTIASGVGAALSPSMAMALAVAIAMGGGSAPSPSLAYAIGAAIASGSGNAPSQSLGAGAGAARALGSGTTLSATLAAGAGGAVASGAGASTAVTVATGSSSAIIIGFGNASSLSGSMEFAAGRSIASGAGLALSPSKAAAAGSSIASGVGNAPSTSVASGFGASLVFGNGASHSMSFVRGVALGTATVIPFYPPGRFIPDRIHARFIVDAIAATFTPDQS